VKVAKKVSTLLKFEQDLIWTQVATKVVHFEPELVLQILLENLLLLLQLMSYGKEKQKME